LIPILSREAAAICRAPAISVPATPSERINRAFTFSKMYCVVSMLAMRLGRNSNRLPSTSHSGNLPGPAFRPVARRCGTGSRGPLISLPSAFACGISPSTRNPRRCRFGKRPGRKICVARDGAWSMQTLLIFRSRMARHIQGNCAGGPRKLSLESIAGRCSTGHLSMSPNFPQSGPEAGSRHPTRSPEAGDDWDRFRSSAAACEREFASTGCCPSDCRSKSP
jgi:hypothetical protein